MDETDLTDEQHEQNEATELKKANDRAAYLERQREKDNKKFEEMQSKLAAFESKEKEQGVAGSEAFKNVGLSPKHAALFLREYEDGAVNEERARELAEKYDLAVSSSTTADASQSRTFVQPTQGTPVGNSSKMSEAEWSRINSENPLRGVQLANSNQVDWGEETLRLSQTQP